MSKWDKKDEKSFVTKKVPYIVPWLVHCCNDSLRFYAYVNIRGWRSTRISADKQNKIVEAWKMLTNNCSQHWKMSECFRSKEDSPTSYRMKALKRKTWEVNITKALFKAERAYSSHKIFMSLWSKIVCLFSLISFVNKNFYC